MRRTAPPSNCRRLPATLADPERRARTRRGCACARPGSPICTWARPAARRRPLLDFLRHRGLRDAVPGRRHHRRLAAEAAVVLAAVAQRRGAEAAAQGAQGHAGDLRPRQPRRVRAPLRGAQLRRCGRGGGVHPHLADGRGCGSRTATCSTASSSAPSGWPTWATGPTRLTLRVNRHLNSLARAAGPALLEPVALPEAEGQARRQLCQGTSRRPSRGRHAQRGMQGVVCGHIHHAEIRSDIGRHPVLQRRRLGRKPDGAGRTRRRAAGNPGLVGPARCVSRPQARGQRFGTSSTDLRPA